MGRRLHKRKPKTKGLGSKKQFVRDCYSAHAASRALERLDDVESVDLFKSPDRVVRSVRQLILDKSYDVIQMQHDRNARTAEKMLGRALLCVTYKGRRLFPVWDWEFRTVVTFVPDTDPRVVAWLKRKFSE